MAKSGSASIKPIGIPIDDVCDIEDDEIAFTPETLEAIEEAERIARDPNAKTYNSFDEILQEIDEEIAEEDRVRQAEASCCAIYTSKLAN